MTQGDLVISVQAAFADGEAPSLVKKFLYVGECTSGKMRWKISTNNFATFPNFKNQELMKSAENTENEGGLMFSFPTGVLIWQVRDGLTTNKYETVKNGVATKRCHSIVSSDNYSHYSKHKSNDYKDSLITREWFWFQKWRNPKLEKRLHFIDILNFFIAFSLLIIL